MGLTSMLRGRATWFLVRRDRRLLGPVPLHPAVSARLLASDHDHHHVAKPGDGSARGVHAADYHDPSELSNEPVPADYVPGTDSYAFRNPHPMVNRGRLDWLFDDGWRRPAKKEEGQRFRAEWVPFGFNVYDEYDDWRKWHAWAFATLNLLFVGVLSFFWLAQNDWPDLMLWCRREAHLEMARRRAAGLPLISKDFIDPARLAPKLPSEDELGDFEIIICDRSVCPCA